MTRPALAAPAVSRNARRVTCVGVLMSRLLGRAVDGGADPLVSAAAADVRHRGVDVRVRRVGVRREQRGRCHELARLAIAALRYVLRDPRFLDAMAPVRREAFDRGHALSGHRRDRGDARAGGDTVQMDGTRAALCDAAAELGAGEAEGVAQHPQQRGVRGVGDRTRLAVEDEGDRGHRKSSSEEVRARSKTDVASRAMEGGMDCCTGAAPGAVRTAPFVPFSRAMTTYARRLGLFSGTMAVIGGIIGGGIFRTPATVAERVGSPTLVLAVWIVGGVVAL